MDECGENHEDSVGLHLGARQVAPAEVVIHTIEAAFGGRPLVVEHNDFLLAHVVVVGEDAVVDVPAVNIERKAIYFGNAWEIAESFFV